MKNQLDEEAMTAAANIPMQGAAGGNDLLVLLTFFGLLCVLCGALLSCLNIQLIRDVLRLAGGGLMIFGLLLIGFLYPYV